jgi:hypothetical protein
VFAVSIVKACLDLQFPSKWTARGCPIARPPRPPDLTPLHLLLWGYTKDLVHQTKAQDVDEPRRRITAACETVSPVGAAKQLATGGVSCGYLQGHQGSTSGDLLRSIETWKVSASFSAVRMFLSTLG